MYSQQTMRNQANIGGYWNQQPLSALVQLYLPQILSGKAAQEGFRFACLGDQAEEDAVALSLVLSEVLDTPLDRPTCVNLLSTQPREAITENKLAASQGAHVGAHTFASCFRYCGDTWKVQIEAPIEFVRHALPLDLHWEGLEGLELVLARRFGDAPDSQQKCRILQQLHKVMAPYGILLIGAQDLPDGYLQGFERIKPHLAGAFRIVA